jgi:arylsulfatase A-like enzyme
VITADHGEAFGEHDCMQHANGSVYQDQVHVPLVIKYPGQHEARRSDALASHVDLMPTIFDVAGIPVPATVQGQSLRLHARGDSDAVFTEARAMGRQQEIPRFRGVRRAIFSGSSKFISWTNGPAELYNLAADSAELHNQIPASDPGAAALAGRMAQWIASIPKNAEQTRKLDKRSVERLKSLGYVQ